jgi:hypothetical protein
MSFVRATKLAPLALGLCLTAGATLLSATPSSAAPASNIGVSAALQSDLVQNVQYRRHGYYGHRGYYGPRGRYYGYRRGGAVAAGVIGGLALGAALGAAAAAPPPPPAAYYEPDYAEGYAGGDDWLAYCSSKYRSFDPRTGTYLGYDGLRHPCQ